MSDPGRVPEPRSASLTFDVLVDAPAPKVWAAVVDWDRQGEWLPGTKVRGTFGAGVGAGGGVEARTGFAGISVLDTMVITRWEPPRRCTVRHTGRVVRGVASFEVLALPGGRCRLVWSEQLDLPFGVVGQLSWGLLRPVLGAVARAALSRLARMVESGAFG